MNSLLKINELDNVATALVDLKSGYCENGICLIEDVPQFHKVLLRDLKAGDTIFKYGNPIGVLSKDCKSGCHIHEHNLKTTLSDKNTYLFNGDNLYQPKKSDLNFNGYVRSNGSVGIRNDIWIIPTVGCVNSIVNKLAKLANEKYGDLCDGFVPINHQFGCSQSGEDQVNTQNILSGLCKHPNCGGVLIVSLGCENNNLKEFLPYLGEYDKERIKHIVVQDVEDEISSGIELLYNLAINASKDKREKVGIEKLKIGFKCGGSDSFSGITANAVCGVLNNDLTDYGCTTILTEVPEMFGAEHILMSRCENEVVFDKCVNMINRYKEYFSKHGEVCYNNPSPGNHEGGITTLEEKSLGCIQKGGDSVVTDVLDYGNSSTLPGLNLLNGPGNDIIAITNLVSAGAQVVLFTTGRGTPLGGIVPTVKISTNNNLYKKKSNWIDFNCGEIVNGKSLIESKENLKNYLIDVCNGKKTKNEEYGYKDIAILKNGVTM